MTTDKTLSIEHYLPLYLGQECIHESKPIIGNRFVLTIGTLLEAKVCNCKLLLRPLMSMTPLDFIEISEYFFGAKTFAQEGNMLYATKREKPFDYNGTDIEFIDECGDDDPTNVLMFDQIFKRITYGWIIREETWQSLSITEEAELITILLKKGFDLFRLIESGLALDTTTLKN